MEERVNLDFLKRLAHGLAEQFGTDCEVVVHDLTREDHDNTIVAIENGHVSGRTLGDGPSRVALEAMQQRGPVEDRLNYFTKARDGRMLRSSTIFIKDETGKPTGILALNYDLSKLLMADQALRQLMRGIEDSQAAPSSSIPTNVNDLLDQLIDQSVALVGKPVPLMTKDDKMRAIQFLNEAGAFLITRSGDKISKFFGISKYTMYTYFDAKETKDDAQD